MSAFVLEDGMVHHTYSTYARGAELLTGAFNWLDLTPKGRNEAGIMNWVRLHDEYDGGPPPGRHEREAGGADAACCASSERAA